MGMVQLVDLNDRPPLLTIPVQCTVRFNNKKWNCVIFEMKEKIKEMKNGCIAG